MRFLESGFFSRQELKKNNAMKKTRIKKIPWWEPRINVPGAEELLLEVLRSNFPNDGDFTTQFEEEVARRLGVKYAVGVTSGTAAMFLALKALDIGHGDEVIVPDITFIATANAVSMAGAKPILVDIDPATMTMDPVAFESAITSRTKAVIPVHVSGRAADMTAIMRIATAHGIHVVEDAAEALLSRHKGKNLGTFGAMGCFSFSPHKIITLGQGGLVVTDNKQLHFNLRKLKDQGRPVRGTGGDDIHESIGYNFRLTNLQAVLGLAQLACLEERVKRMVQNYEWYATHLRQIDGLSFFGFNIAGHEVPQWTDVAVDKRDVLDQYLRKQNIECRRFWFPIHSQAPYRQSDKNFPQSTRMSPQALWLPSAFTMTKGDLETVCVHIKRFMK
ncbi:MAG: DegT/DnrJ/EryC1/StrS aminotransferase [candidate division CPR1 bacterium GW2011_GWA2_42_17]|uniref:DegT/DnrJ/EryC1/StrS aminotransferase n=1 Tax=candidate division CPR1 bacterium GW2011_GWA2_42_17 TaxID=1618341 RepID=A0A0G1BB00_9BACT|nr:MAG: DegT/DnrJ/EryC1/StrS aminotransferase [candidate division CPR1 bacterium GW2011_GWA2_42_17]